MVSSDGGCAGVLLRSPARRVSGRSGCAGDCGELMEGGDVAALCRQCVERGLLLLDFRLQHIGRIRLADVCELSRGLGRVGGNGAQLFARVDLLL